MKNLNKNLNSLSNVDLIIKCEPDLDKFKLYHGNRSINPQHVQRLKLSIEQDNLLHHNPIIVDEEFQVMDGQHRLEAARELEIPIYYVTDNNFSSSNLILLNNNILTWSIDDYIYYYEQQGNEHYLKLRQLADMLQFSVSNVLAWAGKFSRTKNNLNSVRSGQFTMDWFTDEDIEYLTHAKNIMSLFQEHTKISNVAMSSSSLHKALSSWMRCKHLDIDRFKKNIIKYPHLVHKCRYVLDYLDMFSELYNHYHQDRLQVVRIGNSSSYRILPIKPPQEDEIE